MIVNGYDLTKLDQPFGELPQEVQWALMGAVKSGKIRERLRHSDNWRDPAKWTSAEIAMHIMRQIRRKRHQQAGEREMITPSNPHPEVRRQEAENQRPPVWLGVLLFAVGLFFTWLAAGVVVAVLRSVL